MLENISNAIAALLPPALRNELRGNIEAVVRSNFEKMNLVTREQFEVQEKVLHRTRERLLALEKQIDALAKQLAAKPDAPNNPT